MTGSGHWLAASWVFEFQIEINRNRLLQCTKKWKDERVSMLNANLHELRAGIIDQSDDGGSEFSTCSDDEPGFASNNDEQGGDTMIRLDAKEDDGDDDIIVVT